MRFVNDNGALVFYHLGETVRIEAWGKDSLRVRSTMFSGFTGNAWALTAVSYTHLPLPTILRV